jgi:predicted metal-dependent enzyme (double-stranded beta helix superfamily)
MERIDMTSAVSSPTYTLQHLVDDTRTAILEGHNIPETVGGIRRGLQSFLNDPAQKQAIYDRWAADGSQGGNLYKDPELDFVITAGKGTPGVQRPAHDHSDCWAVYGVLDGAIRMRRYRLLTPIGRNTWEGRAEIESIAEFLAEAGRIDGILPGHIHDLRTEGEAESISVIVRCHALNTIWRNFYDLNNGTFRRVRGSGG